MTAPVELMIPNTPAESTPAGTAPLLTPTFPGGPAESPKIEVTLGHSGGAPDQLVAGIQRWPAETGEAGDFPEVTEILLTMLTDQGLATLTAGQARALVPELHQFADQLDDLADQLDALGGAPVKATTLPARTSTFSYKPPAWANIIKSGSSGTGDRFAWVTHEGTPAVLAVPTVDGMDDSDKTIVAANLYQFSEETEPMVTYLRVVSGDIDCDLTAAEADTLIADADAWLTAVKAMRALMPAEPEQQGGGRA